MNIRQFLIKYKFVLVMFTGIVIGTLYVNLTMRTGNEKWNVFSSSYLADYSDVTVNSLVLWQYVIKSRIRDFLLIFLIGLTSLCRPFLLLYLLFFGVCCGSLLSVAVMHYGASGILMYLASVLPQYLFYIVAFYFLYKILYKRSAKMKNIVIVFGISSILMMIGTYLEAYLNPLILKNLYVFFY